MNESVLPTQEQLEQYLFDDLDEYVVQMQTLIAQLIKEGPILEEDIHDLEWARDRVVDSVDAIKFVLEIFEKDIGNRGATSHIALQLRLALINTFSIGQIMHSMSSAKRLLDRERTRPASQARSAHALERAMGLRSLFARWPRKNGEKSKFDKPGALLTAAQKIPGYEKIDRKTLFSYAKALDRLAVGDAFGKTVGLPK